MSGKHIVFCTFGSLGDLYPLLALAREMKHRGAHSSSRNFTGIPQADRS